MPRKKHPRSDGGKHVTPRITISVEPERHERWRREAQRAGARNLNEWIRATLDAAAGTEHPFKNRPGPSESARS